MYGKVVVLLMIAFCLIEVMDNKVAPLTFQVYIYALKKTLRYLKIKAACPLQRKTPKNQFWGGGFGQALLLNAFGVFL
jgi:hypothetical protein